MNKKPPVNRISMPKPRTRNTVQSWHNGADVEIFLYARSLQKAAKTLVEKLERDQNAGTDWDACPIVLLYRQALELQLKTLVGEGSDFLKSRADPISLYSTHSLRWLAQIVCQIIKTVGWESNFTCEGVSSLVDFRTLVNEVESLDPITRAVQACGKSSVSQNQPFSVVQFAKRMAAVLDLLDVTADALAAKWDERTALEPEFQAEDDCEPTIQ